MARPGTLWSVKGIDRKTRDIAKRRAAESGLTIGAWIDRTILEVAQQTPTLSHPPRLNAVPGPGAVPGLGPVSGPGVVSGPGEGALATLLEGEIKASQDRMDEALRRIGLAIEDLAQRMVASEQRVQAATKAGPSSVVPSSVVLLPPGVPLPPGAPPPPGVPLPPGAPPPPGVPRGRAPQADLDQGGAESMPSLSSVAGTMAANTRPALSPQEDLADLDAVDFTPPSPDEDPRSGG